MRLFTTSLLFLSLLTCGNPARAGLVTFFGIDPGAEPTSPRPMSNAAAASFDAAAAALGPITLDTFESAPLGDFTMLSRPGYAITKTGTTAEGGILNAPGSSILGYNTTAGGSRYLGVWPIFDVGTTTVNFDFDSPVQAWGAYITGLGTAAGDLHVVFNDGTARDLSVTGSPAGGSLFFGFTDEGTFISRISLELRGVIGTRDIFAVDDMRFVPSGGAVPEPSGLVLFAFGVLGLFGHYGRRRRQAS
jgi:hypothetical protein